jgi:hypothetical protein
MNDNNTPRRYPRTLLEAFPHDPQNAYTITRYKPRMSDHWAVMLVTVFAFGFVIGLLVGEMPK